MRKTCTNSRCRRSFSTESPEYQSCCPFCGKQYPRLVYRYDLILRSYGSDKIRVIKEMRRVTGLGLAEAKELVGSAPVRVFLNCGRQDAELHLEKLLSLGAKAKLAPAMRGREWQKR